MNKIKQPRPSRTYVNGIGKPVVAKRRDPVLGVSRWDVVFPPCNNFGTWVVAPEAKLVAKAQAWCFMKNFQLREAEIEAARPKQ